LSPIVTSLLWPGLVAVLAAGLAVELWTHRRARPVSAVSAAGWTAAWVGLASLCAAAIWLALGPGAFAQFAAGYAVEWSLSVDNVVAFIALVVSLAVPRAQRHRVLFLGSLGAIALRLALLVPGSALLTRFAWLTAIFGAVLLLAAARLARELSAGESDQPTEPAASGVLQRWLPRSGDYDGGRLTTVVAGRRLATPLLLALLAIGLTDVVFATDSIPAVLAVTHDPFIASASNGLAVLGVRSLVLLVENVSLRLRFLKPALVVLLALLAAKMLAEPIVGAAGPLPLLP